MPPDLIRHPLDNHLDPLNDAQRQAVEHGVGSGAGPLLVIAGTGSGKTNTLAHRVAWPPIPSGNSAKSTSSSPAAIQRWKPLLEMEDSDRHDVIDNNLNETANTVRAFAPGMVKREYGASSCSPRCRASRARPAQARPPQRNGESSG